MTKEREVLIPIVPKDDFERLLYAQARIIELIEMNRDKDVKIGELESYVLELEYKPNDKPLTDGQRIQVQKDVVVTEYKRLIIMRGEQINRMRNTIKDLITENAKLKQNG